MAAADKLRLVIASFVTTLWGFSAVVGVFTNNFTELGIITPVMMLVGAFLFTSNREQQKRNDDR